jgi:hypothetical protein
LIAEIVHKLSKTDVSGGQGGGSVIAAAKVDKGVRIEADNPADKPDKKGCC